MNDSSGIWQRIRSLWSFLAIPLGVVALFLIGAAVTYQIDDALSKDLVHHNQLLSFLSNLFGDRDSMRSLLGTIASALITITSITFSLLLVAVQQAAASFSNQILQQFRNRKSNQFYFGFFVGLSLYTLVTLATMSNIHHPIFGVLFSILFTVVALLLILVLLYTTIEQMRGSSVINAIASRIRSSRQNEDKLLKATRRRYTRSLPIRRSNDADASGTITSVDVDAIADCLRNTAPQAELVFKATEGVYVGRGDTVAQLHSKEDIGDADWETLCDILSKAVTIGSDPPLSSNPHVGLSQLATIGWNNTSTAVSNPHPPILICRAVRNILWEWMKNTPDPDRESQIVYPDLSLSEALTLLESMAVASGESKQPQTLGEIYETYAVLLPILPDESRDQVEEAVRLSIGALPQHLPTQQLNKAMERLADALEEFKSPLANDLRRVLRIEKKESQFPKKGLVHDSR